VRGTPRDLAATAPAAGSAGSAAPVSRPSHRVVSDGSLASKHAAAGTATSTAVVVRGDQKRCGTGSKPFTPDDFYLSRIQERLFLDPGGGVEAQDIIHEVYAKYNISQQTQLCIKNLFSLLTQGLFILI
jgi:hypothetical protein